MNILHMATFTLAMVGGLNWGLVGLFDFNLVSTLLGAGSMLEQAAYVLVGVAAVYVLVTHRNDCKICSAM